MHNAEAVRPIRSHVSRALCAAIPTLDKSDAGSLIEFYQTEPGDSTRPPYNSRRHSPERLIIDLPQQLALAVEVCPPPEPPRKHDYTLQEVHDYLTATYQRCYLPTSVEELDKPWLEYMRDEIENGIRERRKNRTNAGLG